jgi:hypothetical protein
MTNAKLQGTHLEFTVFWRHIAWWQFASVLCIISTRAFLKSGLHFACSYSCVVEFIIIIPLVVIVVLVLVIVVFMVLVIIVIFVLLIIAGRFFC